MYIKTGKKAGSKPNEGFNISLEDMSSFEFDNIRILLKSLVENDTRFSNVEESQLGLEYVMSLLSYKE